MLAVALLSLSVTSVLAAGDTPEPAGEERMFIRQIRVKGVNSLPPEDVQKAVYPHLGPLRTAQDVENARAALQQAYHDAGYQTVQVEVPMQNVHRGVVYLQAVENKVGRLRVRNSRYFSIEKIKQSVPSLAEGTVPNFNHVTREIIRINQLPDRRITPSLTAGVEEGTVDIDLMVEDTLPLHGSVELNNRYSADTTPLRVNASLSYNNLWQLGHTLGFGYQVAPENPDESTVYSGYYIARFPDAPKFSLLFQGTKQDSNVSTLGGAAVAGRGEILGMRFIFTLEPREGFFHSVNFGFDYKDFTQEIDFGGTLSTVPIVYYPISLAYSATWVGKGYSTELNSSLVFHWRGVGSDPMEFDDNRYNADGSFLYLKADASHTQDLPSDFKLYARIHGQASGYPLLNSEQFGGGGQDSVRGYLEAEALGDSAIAGTLEIRSPSLLAPFKIPDSEWRIHAFVDAAYLALNDALPEQNDRFELASIGVGSTLRIFDHLNGSIDIATPLLGFSTTGKGDTRLLFRVWGEF